MSDRDEFTKWIDAQRDEIRQFHAELEKDLRNWNEPNTTSSHSDRSAGRDRGPFERFKSFVDSNLGTLVNGIRNFPSNVAELKAQMETERLARQKEELEISRRWTGSWNSPDFIATERERATDQEKLEVRKAAVKLLRQAFIRNDGVKFDKIEKLYRDDEGESEFRGGALDNFALGPLLSWGGGCYYRSETDDNLPSTAQCGASTYQRQRWLSVDWFKRSPYSPINIEAQEWDQEEGTKWRAAFEDLLCATLDKPMVREERIGIREPYGKAQSTIYGPGLEWMLSLQCRGILPPQLPSLYQREPAGWRRSVQSRHVEYESLGQCLKSLTVDRETDWESKHWAHMKTNWQALVDEIGTKSGPLTSAQPLPPVRTPWQVPDTEEELYQQMLPPGPPPPSGRIVEESLSSEEEKHWYRAYVELEQAFLNNDVTRVRACLEEYRDKTGSIGRLVRNVICDVHRMRERWLEDEDEDAFVQDSMDELLEKDELLREAVSSMAIRDPKTDPWPTLVLFSPWQRQEFFKVLCRARIIRRQFNADSDLDGLNADKMARLVHISDPGFLEYSLQLIQARQGESEEDGKFRQLRDFYEELAKPQEENARRLRQAREGVGEPMLEEQSDAQALQSDQPHEALQDSPSQLLLLEQQNRKRLSLVRQDADEEQEEQAYSDRTQDLKQQGKELMEEQEQFEREAITRGWQKPGVRHDSVVERPNILSQLTTTQTTRLPDGTVTTKVVLKQRFADGREEVQESVHTSHEAQGEAGPKRSSSGQKREDDTREGSGKKGGWFWS